VIADPQHQNLDVLLKTVYNLYADYVMKNPFYDVEMPIKCDLFNVYLGSNIKEQNKKKQIKMN
jgi:trafficking protein particle complex subunit 4